MSRLKRLIHEIHHRSLWQVLLIYIGAAWACFELIATVADTMGLPGWLPGLAIVLFLLGLPFVVATALVREEPAPSVVPPAATEAEAERAEVEAAALRREATRRLRFLTWRNAAASFVVALAVWGVVATGWLLLGERAPSEDLDARKSIAVLPFDNIGGAEENLAFTDGIHDVVLTHLYKVAGLRPTSRTSVMEYRDTRKNIREIAEELGVETVMEGGVQRAGDRVLVNVQLIDAQTDEHIWAETYGRELTLENIFAIQAEIARQIATALRAEITAEEDERLAGLPTDNLEAYDHYLSGEEYRQRGSEKNLKIAKEMFRSAISLDPQFALAHAKLAETHLGLRGVINPEFRTRERLDSAKVAAERALELGPDLPEAHLALGLSYSALRDDERAMRHYESARRLSPNDAVVWRRIGGLARRQGYFEEASTNFKKALELSPREPATARTLGTTFMLLRRYHEAETYLDRAIALEPDYHYGYAWKGFVALNQPGGAEKAWQVVQEAREKAGGHGFYGADRYRHRAFLRVFHERLRDQVRAYTLENCPYYNVDYLLSKAISYQLDDEIELSLVYYDSARAAIEPLVQLAPDDPGIRQNLGFAYAGLGRVEEAVLAGNTAVELGPVSRDAGNGPSWIASLAEIYLMVGEYEAALDQLEVVLSIPSVLSVGMLQLDPLWDPLSDHPRFQALLAKYE